MIYYSSFNFEEMRNNVEDLSQDINKEHRQPVQHPSGNDCNHLDQSMAFSILILNGIDVYFFSYHLFVLSRFNFLKTF